MAAPKRLTLVIPAEVTAMTLKDRIRAGEPINFAIVRVGNERFAIELSAIVEAVDAGTLDEMPTLPAGALGVLHWRAIAVTVWSPTPVLKAELDGADTAVLVRGPSSPVALGVDDVEDLVTMPGRAVRPVVGKEDATGLVLGVVHLEDDALATVLDPDALAAALIGRAPKELSNEVPAEA